MLQKHQVSVALQQGYQVQVNKFVHAVNVIRCLLISISEVAHNEKIRKQYESNHDSWFLSTCERFVDLLRRGMRERIYDSNSSDLSLIMLSMLEVEEMLILGIELREPENLVVRKTFVLIVRNLQHILRGLCPITNEVIQERLAHLLWKVETMVSLSSSLQWEARKDLACLTLDLVSSLDCISTALSTAIETLISRVASASSTAISPLKLSQRQAKRVTRTISHSASSATTVDTPTVRPVRKRRRIETSPSSTTIDELHPLHTLCDLVGIPYTERLSGISESVAEYYESSSNEARQKTLSILLGMPCIPISVMEQKNCCNDDSEQHRYCDCPQIPLSEIPAQWIEQWRCFFDILCKLIDRQGMNGTKEHHVLIMIALGRYADHARSADSLDLTASTLGKWCMRGLQSSSRELRIAAAQALPGFLRIYEDADGAVSTRNRIVALDFLRKLAELNDIRQTETLILTLGRIADICGDEESNIVLLQLVDLLGHPNPFVCSLAAVELRRLGGESEAGLEILLRPYWRTIAVTVVKDLHTRPQKAQQLCDLLGWSINRLILSTQTETLPYLILWGKKDILERIASARGNGATVWSICMQPRNLTAILSTLIVRHPTDVESSLAEHLMLASSAFAKEDLVNLLRVDKISLACEILKAIGDVDSTDKAHVCFHYRFQLDCSHSCRYLKDFTPSPAF